MMLRISFALKIIICRETAGGAAFTYRDMEFDWDWRKKYFDILKNGYDDTYFLNRNNGSVGMVFGTEEFERVLIKQQTACRRRKEKR